MKHPKPLELFLETQSTVCKKVRKERPQFALRQKLLAPFLAILFAFAGKAQTAGNSCANAINLTLSNTAPATHLNGKLHTSSQWFKFTANANSHPIISINEKQNANKWTVKSVKVYSGNCTNLHLISTFSVSGVSDTTLIKAVHNLVNGNTYFIEINKGTLNPCTSHSCLPNDTAYFDLKVDGGLRGLQYVFPNGNVLACECANNGGGGPLCQITMCVGDDLIMCADEAAGTGANLYWYSQPTNSGTPVNFTNFYTTTVANSAGAACGATTGYFTPTAPGVYYINFSGYDPTSLVSVGGYDNCCGRLQVTVNPLPNYVLTANPNPTCLANQPVTFNVSPTTTLGYNIDFGDGTGNSIYNTLNHTYASNGVYPANVMFSDINGFCAETINDNITIENPVISATAGSICQGNTSTIHVTSNMPGLNYSFNPSTGITGSYPNFFAHPNASTTYQITATTPGGLCSTTTNISVLVHPSPVITVSPSSSNFCAGSSNPIVLTASGGFTYNWTPAGSGLNTYSGSIVNASPNNNEVYTVTGTSLFNCKASATAIVNVIAPPVITVNPNPGVICTQDPGSSVVLTASSNEVNTTYVWNTTQTGNNITVAPTTNTSYVVTGSAPNGCSTSVTVPVVLQPCSCSTNILSTTNITPSTALPALQHSINLPTTVTGAVTITNKVFYMAPNVSITVLSGSTLTLDHCHLLACTDMWKGIIVQPGGTLIVNNNSMIEDAYVAINCANWTSATANALTVDGCVFNRNQIGIEFSETSILPYSSSFNIPATIRNSVFTCRTIASTNSLFNWSSSTPATLKGTVGVSTPLQTPFELANNTAYTTTNLKTPLNAQISNWAIHLVNIGSSSLNGTTSPTAFLATPNTYYDVTIGDNSSTASATTMNLFDNHQIGIYAQSSNFTSVNNAFELMGFTCKKCAVPTGAAIYGINSALSGGGSGNHDFTRANVLYSGFSTSTPPATIPASNCNTFYDCFYSVLLTNYQETNLVGNNIRSRKGSTTTLPSGAGTYGYYVSTPAYQRVNLSYNQVTNINNCITFMATTIGTSQARGVAHSNNNSISAYFGTTPTYQLVSNAIQMDNSTSCYPGGGVTCNTSATSVVTANNNTLQHVYRGIEMSNWSVGKTISSYANSNYVKLLTDPTSISATQFGININNTFIHNIIDNNIVGTGTGNTNMRGIYSVDNSASNISCNYTGTLGTGLEFEGPSTTVWGSTTNGATVSNNTMTVNQHGFVLSGGSIIGAQGSPTSASDNLWTGSWTGRNGTYIDASSSATTSQLYVRSASGVYFPPNNGGTATIFNQYGSNIITGATASTATCSALPQPPCTSCPLSGRTLAERIVQDSTVFPVLANENDFRAQLDIFRAMLVDSTIQDSSAILKSFFLSNLGSSNLNRIVNIESQLNQSNISTAQSLNAAFNPITTIESNHKALFSAIINYATTDSLSVSDSLSLLNLAKSCPALAGDAVYQARAVFNAAYNQYQYFADNCNYDSLAAASGSTSRLANTSGINNLSRNSNGLLVYPNPSTDDVFISSSDLNNTAWTLVVTDVTGRTVIENNYPVNNSLVKLSTQLNNGVYFVKVVLPNGNVKQQKVVITK